METRKEEFGLRFEERMREAIGETPCKPTGEDFFAWDPEHPTLPSAEQGDLFYSVKIVAESRFWRGDIYTSDRYSLTNDLLWQHEFNRFLEWALRLLESDGKRTPLTHELERVREVLLDVAEDLDSEKVSLEEAIFINELLMGFHATVAEGFKNRLSGSTGEGDS